MRRVNDSIAYAEQIQRRRQLKRRSCLWEFTSVVRAAVHAGSNRRTPDRIFIVNNLSPKVIIIIIIYLQKIRQ